MLKRISMMALMIGFLLFLSGCNHSPEKFTLELYWHDGSSNSHQVINDLDREEYALPFLEREGMQFVGWDDGNNIYVDSYIITSNTILTAVFEESTEVFEFEYIEDYDILVLKAYHGQSQRIRIPEQYDGHYLSEISQFAFKDSNILSVEIPMTVTKIRSLAFEDAASLREVSWYGAPHGLKIDTSVFPVELEAELLAYGDACVVRSVDGLKTQYESGCPIVETVQSESVFVGDVEYFSFQVTYDLEYAPEKQVQIIEGFAFKGAVSLESFDVPAGLQANSLNGQVLGDAPFLSQISVDENNMSYKVVDGALYSKEMDYLYYYPNGLNASRYVIPDTVQVILPYAFYQNESLEEIVISKNINMINQSFVGMYGLKNFVVAEDNETYDTQDGVLYASMGEDILIAYPGGKLEEVYEIPEGTVMINISAFAYNNHLREVVMNDELRVIGRNAFAYTTSIDILEIPGSVEEMEFGIIENSQIKTVIILSDSTLNIPFDNHAFLIERFMNSIENPYTYADVYISDDIYDDYILSNNLNSMTDFYHKLSEYEEE